MLDLWSIGYSAYVNSIIEFFPRMPRLVDRRRLKPVKFALEGIVASEVGIPGPKHIPITTRRMD